MVVDSVAGQRRRRASRLPHDEVADPAYALAALRDSEPRTVVGRF
ncbi:hypothetical protein [Lapillicoccus sp.]